VRAASPSTQAIGLPQNEEQDVDIPGLSINITLVLRRAVRFVSKGGPPARNIAHQGEA